MKNLIKYLIPVALFVSGCDYGSSSDPETPSKIDIITCKDGKATFAIEPTTKDVETDPPVLTVFYYNNGCSILLEKECLVNSVTAICGENKEITFIVK